MPLNQLDGLMSFTARQLALLHQMMNSDDPCERQFAWFIVRQREEALRKK